MGDFKGSAESAEKWHGDLQIQLEQTRAEIGKIQASTQSEEAALKLEVLRANEAYLLQKIANAKNKSSANPEK